MSIVPPRRGALAEADRATARAWERFVAGEDETSGVRPDIVASWMRCRDQFRIDPSRERALPADPDPALAPAESVVAAELGAAATHLLPDVISLGGVVVVADGRGRMLSAWGDERSSSRGAEQNLGPLYSWSEPSVGTAGVSEALLARGCVTVRRAEHWCAAFQDWSCAAVAVGDPSGRPTGVIGISAWQRELPDSVTHRLTAIASDVERRLVVRLRERALVERRQPPEEALHAPARLVGVRGGRNVIVPVARIGLVAVDQGLVWLVTDEGKLRSAARSIDQLERQLEPAGFVRVSRVALVNIERVREVIPAFKGGMWIAVDGVSTPVAVARRRVAALRRALGI